MIVKAKIANQNEFLFMEEIPDKYSHDHRLSEKLLTIRDSAIEMKNQQISTNGMFLLYSEMLFDQPLKIVTEVEGEAIASQFIFSRESGTAKKQLTAGYRNSRHNIRYIPSAKETFELRSGVQYTYFMLVLSKEYYLHLVDFCSPMHEEFVRDMEKGIYTSFSEDDLFVTPEMRKSIDDIRDCKQEGMLKRLFTDARVLELIMYQLEQFGKYVDPEKMVLRDEDITRLESAREILEQDYMNPPTQKQLSKMVMLNEFKLRSGFKQYFGSTIYDYITRLRMEVARKLIVQESKNMYEVGIEVGFKHQASFTNAFKKYYGILPSEVRV